MDDQEFRRERRRQARLERLRTNKPRCPCCGELDDRAFELHHVGRKALNPSCTVPVCSNCHDRLSDMQKDHPIMSKQADKTLARVGEFLLGLADMLKLIVEKLIEFGEDLIERANWADTGAGEPS